MTKLSEPILTTKSRYLKRFEDIIIQDGSSFALNPALLVRLNYFTSRL